MENRDNITGPEVLRHFAQTLRVSGQLLVGDGGGGGPGSSCSRVPSSFSCFYLLLLMCFLCVSLSFLCLFFHLSFLFFYSSFPPSSFLYLEVIMNLFLISLFPFFFLLLFFLPVPDFTCTFFTVLIHLCVFRISW